MVVNRSREAWKTYGNVFDSYTDRLLEKLATQGYFEELTSAIAMGKEANVFAARTKDGKTVAIKIYRLENCSFNKMYEYISQDPRYAHLKGQRRKIIFAWNQREYRNLMNAREHIRVPTPLAFKDHVLVMEYIDEDGQAAPQLKNVDMHNPQDFFTSIIDSVTQLYKSGLVHGDLSEFNILIQNATPVFIDFSQATATSALNAKELLRRDLEVICRFFKKRGVSSDPEEIFLNILSQSSFKK